MSETTDAGKILWIEDGPSYHPNFKRLVQLICWDSMTGFVLCEDLKTGNMLRVDRHRIERAMMEAI